MTFASDVSAAILTAAQRNGLDPALVAAIVKKESGGNPDAVRAEVDWQWFMDVTTGRPFRPLTAAELVMVRPPDGFHGVNGCSAATEWLGQRMSWGLMQVMGANAREHGLRAPFLSALLDPAEGAEYGCRFFAELLRRFHDAPSALSAYNAGRPVGSNYETYVAPVLGFYEQFKREGV